LTRLAVVPGLAFTWFAWVVSFSLREGERAVIGIHPTVIIVGRGRGAGVNRRRSRRKL
jgi:hypothetical protein